MFSPVKSTDYQVISHFPFKKNSLMSHVAYNNSWFLWFLSPSNLMISLQYIRVRHSLGMMVLEKFSSVINYEFLKFHLLHTCMRARTHTHTQSLLTFAKKMVQLKLLVYYKSPFSTSETATLERRF